MRPLRVVLLGPPPRAYETGNEASLRRMTGALRGLGIRIHRVDAGPGAPARLRGAYRRGIDVLHLYHAIHAGHAADLAPPPADIPWILTVGGTDLSDARAASRALLCRVLRRCAAVVLPGRAWEPLLLRLGVPRNALHIVAKGIEQTRAIPSRAGRQRARPGRPLLLCLGNARPVKGQRELVRDIGPFLWRGDADLLLAGAAVDPAYARTLREALRGVPHARWIGPVPPRVARTLLARSTLLIHPARAEGQSNAIAEAFAAGIPVVARDVPANRELVRASRAGWLYRDGPALRRLLTRVLADPARLERAGRRGRAWARPRTAAREAAAYARIYRSV